MTERCARWMELSDRLLLGDALAKGDVEFLRAHELECVACGREASVLRELRPPPLHVVPSDEEVQRILLLADAPPVDRSTPAERRGHPWGRRAGAVAALLAIAATLVLMLGQRERTATLPARAPALATGSAKDRALPPTPQPESVASRVTEDSCGPLVEGIVLCLAAGTEVGRVELEGPKRTVELKRGRAVASLDPQPPGSSFSIVTNGGAVTAVGTVFSVEQAGDGNAYARVTRGKVLVRASQSGTEQVLLAGQQLRFGDGTASALPLSEAERDLELVARWTSSLDLSGRRSEVAVAAPERGRTAMNAAEPVAIADELGRARELRSRGLFTRAAEIYRSIHARSPHSESGRAALMSLAGLQATSLGDPRGALASYETYLAGGGGPLRQQAEYGRIRALRRLGRTAQELDATRRFIARYPSAPEARLLRERVVGMREF